VPEAIGINPPPTRCPVMYYVVCSRCSYVLYSGEKPVEIIRVLAKYGDKCPRCLKKLSLEPKKVVVKVHKQKRSGP